MSANSGRRMILWLDQRLLPDAGEQVQLPLAELVRSRTPNGVYPASPFRLRRLDLGVRAW